MHRPALVNRGSAGVDLDARSVRIGHAARGVLHITTVSAEARPTRGAEHGVRRLLRRTVALSGVPPVRRKDPLCQFGVGACRRFGSGTSNGMNVSTVMAAAR